MKFSRVIATLAPILLARMASAHFLWASFDATKPNQIRIELAETPGDSPVAGIAGKAASVQGWLPNGRSLALSKEMTANADGVAGASLIYGILDRSEQNRGIFLLNYYAKAATDAKFAGTSLGLYAEIVAEVKGGKLVLTTLLNKKPAPGAELNVLLGTGAPIEAKADAQGQWSTDWKVGQVVAARAMIAENKTGEIDGKKYALVRNYATLAIGASAPKPANDPAAYNFLKNASEARASFPKGMLGFSADFTANVEGREVKGHVVYDPGSDLQLTLAGGTDKDQAWVRGQIRSQILHRSGVPFEKGDGTYAITFTGSENALGKQVALADSMQSKYRIHNDEILEVDRVIGGERLIVCVLDTLRTKAGKRLSTQMSVTHFAADGTLKATEMITDQFEIRDDIAFPGVRRVLLTTPGGIATRTLTFSNLKTVIS